MSDTTFINSPRSAVFATLMLPDIKATYEEGVPMLGTLPYEYTKLVPDELIEEMSRLRLGELHHRCALRASGDGTRLEQTITFVPNGRLSALLWPAMERTLSTRVRTMNERVKRYAEAYSPPA